jgi:hypothetical protein
LWTNREKTLQILRRCETAGFGAIVVTIDNPIFGRKPLDYNPFALLKTSVCPLYHPYLRNICLQSAVSMLR